MVDQLKLDEDPLGIPVNQTQIRSMFAVLLGDGIRNRCSEEFNQSIHTFIDDKRNLAQHTHGKKKATLIVISSIRFTKMIIYHLQRKHKFHLRPDSPLHLPNKEPVLGYLKFNARGTKREVFGMPIPLAEDVPGKEPQVDNEEADMHRALEESLKSMYDVPWGPLPPVVIRELESRKYQPLPKVPGKGKEKVIEEQVARDLLNLQTPIKKSSTDRYIFQRRTFTPSGSSEHDESSSLYAELGLTDIKEESKEDVPRADAGGQGEGQAGPDPGAQVEGQAGPDPGAQDEGQDGSNLDEQPEGQAGPYPGNAKTSQPMPSPVVHAGLDREHMDLDVADVSTQPPPEQMDEGFTATAYPMVQENLKLTVEEHVLLEEPVSSSGTLSSLQHLTKDLCFGASAAQSNINKNNNNNNHNNTSTTISTTKSTTDAMMMKRIGELEHIMADLIQENKRLEQRLDSRGARLYTLEQLDIPHQVCKAVNEVVTNAVDWDSYKSHEDHMQLYEALEKSVNSDHSEELAKDLAEARLSGASGSPRAFGSSQVLPSPPPPPSTNQEDSLLVQTDDIAMFMDWFCKRRRITELKPQYLEGPTFEIIKVFHPDVIHLQYQMEECHMILTDSVDDSILRHNVSKPLPLGGPPGQMKAAYYPDVSLEQMVPDQMWIEEECKYDIAAMYGIFHWWFQRQRFYIDRHTSEGDCKAVRTHMQILSVVRIEVFSMYGYDYIKKIVLRRSDLNEHVIAERDFKYLYPSDFEDLYILNLQGHLNHLLPKDKKILTTTVNLWTRHLVIRQRVEDFQLGIESYQTQLNLTKPRWDATGFEYKHDYTVIDSPRAVLFRDRYGVQMIMRFNEIHKFSDGTLHQIDEALDYRVKEFRINKMNPGLKMRFWTRKDVDRSKAFMFAI
nr:hypothetical protein [Tanacetum cinerariifolium]